MEIFQRPVEMDGSPDLLDRFAMEGGDVYTPQSAATISQNTDTVLMVLDSTESDPLIARLMYINGGPYDAQFQLQVFKGDDELVDELVRPIGSRFENLKPVDTTRLGLSDNAAKIIEDRRVALHPIYVARREDIAPDEFGIGDNRIKFDPTKLTGIILSSKDGQRIQVTDRDGVRTASFVGPDGLQMETISGPPNSIKLQARAGGRYILSQVHSNRSGAAIDVPLVVSTAHNVEPIF